MRIVSIDPGTYSFDLFGMENNETIIIDEAINSMEIFKNPLLLMDKLEKLMPLDAIIGPSGYGIPVKHIKDMNDTDLSEMIPMDTQAAVNEGIKKLIMRMKEKNMPVYFTPGAINLKTIPEYRKWNKLDMGTADKVCCAALGIKDQAQRLNIKYEETSFIYIEVGYGFTAAMAIENGKIVDGIGGTCGSVGFLSGGGMDGEIAIRLKTPLTQDIVFKSGVKDFTGQNIEPKDLIRFKKALTLLAEDIEKDAAALMVSNPNAKEIIISGRLTNYDFISEELKNRLNKYAPTVKVKNLSKITKDAAFGAYIIGEGLLGGKYATLVENMELTNTKTTATV